MQYRDHEFQYELDGVESETESIRQQTSGKEYRRKRTPRSTRKRGAKSSSSKPSCGIGGRRNNRWSW